MYYYWVLYSINKLKDITLSELINLLILYLNNHDLPILEGPVKIIKFLAFIFSVYIFLNENMNLAIYLLNFSSNKNGNLKSFAIFLGSTDLSYSLGVVLLTTYIIYKLIIMIHMVVSF
jgi:hypothetical protein